MNLRSPARCAQCAHFRNEPAHLEHALPGLSSLSSAYAAVRSADGLCDVHDRYVSAGSGCPQFASRLQAA